MTDLSVPMADHLTKPTQIDHEISITGKWIPATPGGIFRKSLDAKGMLQEWDDIHRDARNSEGVLSTEINHAVGEDAVLVHHVFENQHALVNYFKTTGTAHMGALLSVAKPQIHLVRGQQILPEIQQALAHKQVEADFGEYLFGYVKEAYRRPDPSTAIQVTAKWTCHEESNDALGALRHWWQMVGTDAFEMEPGLLRFEVFQVLGENALIIHETFTDTDELKFHLSKGTAEKYKKDIDKIASPECYFFRGPVSWTIRTYSKFLRLPATYSSQGSAYTSSGGSKSDGLL